MLQFEVFILLKYKTFLTYQSIMSAPHLSVWPVLLSLYEDQMTV
jgi:hypothetical protein